MNSYDIQLEKHCEMLKQLRYSENLLNAIINTSESLIEFCEINSLNYFELIKKLLEINELYFIITSREFNNLFYPGDYVDKLIDFLIKNKFIRFYEDDKYLLSEFFRYFVETIDRKTINLECIEYSEIYSEVDSMKVEEAIKFYQDKHKREPYFSEVSFCKYFGYEF